MSHSTKKNSKKKPVIICVDDEKFILDTINKQLQRRFGTDYEYEFAESAEEALDIIQELIDEGYDVMMVISDQIMPGMTGDKLLSKIHSENPNPIKILLTGQASLDSAVNVINNANLFRYLTKPWQEDDLLLTVERGINQFNLIEEIKKKTEVFSYFVPKPFLDCLSIGSTLDVKLGDHVQREMSVMFVDIRNFTTISEKLTPEENYNFINNYLKYVEPCIQKNNGFIDKYIGDAILALFYTAEEAQKAAYDMQKAFHTFNNDYSEHLYTPLKSGIGMHTGSLMLGVIGVPNRMQTTVISDAVNIAARLEQLTAYYGCQMLVSEQFFKGINRSNERIPQRFLGKIRVKGRSQTVHIYELLAPDTDPLAPLKLNGLPFFQKGLEQYFDKIFAEACVNFNLALKECPQDNAAKHYLERSAKYMIAGVDETWDGVETHNKNNFSESKNNS
jgi:two-component system sensor histidine kinase ChiS